MEMNINEIKKELYRTKVMAKFNRYASGNLYYSVEMDSGIYQFPIPTIEKISDDAHDLYHLSKDLGTTSFESEVRASHLNRWIAKAVENNEFIKIW